MITTTEKIEVIRKNIELSVKDPIIYLGCGGRFNRPHAAFGFNGWYTYLDNGLTSEPIYKDNCKGRDVANHYFVKASSDIARLNGHRLVTETKKRIKL